MKICVYENSQAAPAYVIEDALPALAAAGQLEYRVNLRETGLRPTKVTIEGLPDSERSIALPKCETDDFEILRIFVNLPVATD